jgi:polysaccharide pyruvyl transferase WcaK-like protein
MSPRQIVFFGNFGTKNLGNECTLDSIVQAALKRVPDARLLCLCPVPADTAARHHITAFASISAPPSDVDGFARLGRRIFRIPIETLHWLKGIRLMAGSEMLIVPGTGLISDHLTGPMGWPYDTFKWSAIAKLCGVKVLFVNVGVGPINHPLSKWFIKTSLRIADYRSYRDIASKQYLDSIGFFTDRDRVCPDLAFGLPQDMFSEQLPGGRDRRVVGVGLKDYHGPEGSADQPDAKAYHDYLGTMAAFVQWLCKHNYTVRVLIGDVTYDSRVALDFVDLLVRNGISLDEGCVISEPALTVEQLLAQLATTDLVISPRFHNLVLALMHKKPVLALSSHPKLDSLMVGLSLAEYCVPLQNLSVDILIERFLRLEKNAEELEPYIGRKAESFREELDIEYSEIFSLKQHKSLIVAYPDAG